MPDPDAPTFLYRFFDQAGDLLYVGITERPFARWYDHESDKAWWAEIARIEAELFPTRVAALDAESTAIKAEGPRHNRRGGAPKERTRRPRQERTIPVRALVDDDSIYQPVYSTEPPGTWVPGWDEPGWVVDDDRTLISESIWRRRHPGQEPVMPHPSL